MRYRPSPLSLLALGLLLVASSTSAAKVKVTATLPSLAALAQDVGGPHVEVEVLASPHQDPHYVDPRPSYVLHLAKADLLVVNGLELEAAWLAPLLVQSRNPKIQLGNAGYLDASLVVARQQVPQGGIDRSQGDIHPGGNPHFLFDPRQAERIAQELGRRLALIDPAHGAEFEQRASDLIVKLHDFADAQRARFAALPAARRKVVSYHSSLVYLYDWLGLVEIATIEPKPGIPPTPAHVAHVLKTMKANGTRLIVQEEYYPKSTSSTLAQLAGGAIVLLDGGAHHREGQSYLDHTQKNVEALYAALSR